MELPDRAPRALLALGVLAALALPALSGVFSARLADGFGVELHPIEVRTQALANGTRFLFVVEAEKPERAQRLAFRGGAAELDVGGAKMAAESVTGRSCDVETVTCFRSLTFAFLLADADALAGAWTLRVDSTWESNFMEGASSHGATFGGEGRAFRP